MTSILLTVCPAPFTLGETNSTVTGNIWARATSQATESLFLPTGTQVHLERDATSQSCFPVTAASTSVLSWEHPQRALQDFWPSKTVWHNECLFFGASKLWGNFWCSNGWLTEPFCRCQSAKDLAPRRDGLRHLWPPLSPEETQNGRTCAYPAYITPCVHYFTDALLQDGNFVFSRCQVKGVIIIPGKESHLFTLTITSAKITKTWIGAKPVLLLFFFTTRLPLVISSASTWEGLEGRDAQTHGAHSALHWLWVAVTLRSRSTRAGELVCVGVYPQFSELTPMQATTSVKT